MEMMIEALSMLFTPVNFFFLVVFTIVAIIFGAVPGLGGIVALGVMLPFLYDIPQELALIIMMGLVSAVTTGSNIPAILWGVPGTAGSQATIMDGFPLSERGESVRALSAAYFSSLIGGVIGAGFLIIAVPLVVPLLQIMGSPELLMLAMLGLVMIGSLTQGRPVPGIALALLGLLFGMIGQDPQTGIFRWTFGSIYLWDGIQLEVIALGVFAIPELLDMYLRGSYFKDTGAEFKSTFGEVKKGLNDVREHFFLVLRSSALGTYVGMLPGLGAAVVDWLAYGMAAQTRKNPENFGKGDIRGVIAPEGANNARVGGGLITTLLFGVPGNLTMVFVLASLSVIGVTPGVNLVVDAGNLFYLIIFTVVMANIIACLFGLSFSSLISKICQIPLHYLVPCIIIIVMVAVVQVRWSLIDIYLLGAFGVLGWFLKTIEWPRAPLLLGVVLGPIIEQRYYISMDAYGFDWLLRPGVIILTLAIVATLLFSSKKAKKEEKKQEEDTSSTDEASNRGGS